MATVSKLISVQSGYVGLAIGNPTDRIIGTKESGPGGIESIIEYNGIYLNDRSWIDTFLVTNIDGIDDADIRDSREENPGFDGETPGFALYGGRTIVLQGEIHAKTIWKLRDMEKGLRQAFADLSIERPLKFHNAINPNRSLQIYCKKSQKIQMPEEQTTATYFKRSFSITLRASRPAFVSIDEYYASKDFSTGTFDDLIFTAINNGTYKSSPRFALTGPINDLTLLNEATLETFTLTQDIPAGETWILDTYNRKFYRTSDGAYKFGTLDETSSQTLSLMPGANPISISAAGLTSASLIEMWFRDSLI